ncbi:MAG TPA: hypothetical protein VGX25_33100 [Actinophytocola sp.]|uniref:hypothetical protein n=1 Tax=Actinophytocola sp. TaxID=1872138 RepID=UPI002DDCBC85|nr:hypothetical protein [Actinophytocola sp.]HEV2784249.1 hypothetical protein [Actinophytocola sp.]
MARGTSRAPVGGRRARRALDSARVLDEVVDGQLAFVARLPEEHRRRACDFLAELVMLAQAYRHYAAGWIDRRELDRRGMGTMRRLAEIRRRRRSAAQFTERD